MSEPAQNVSDIITSTIEALGFELIRVSYGGGRKPTLQIMAERPDGTMSVDDCALVSREVSALLDVEDPLPGEFLLEVSSPGIDRPLTRKKDFERWCGFEAKIELDETRDGRRRFRGKMIRVEGESLFIFLQEEKEEIAIPMGEISKAKLLLTEELIAAVMKKSKDAKEAKEAKDKKE